MNTYIRHGQISERAVKKLESRGITTIAYRRSPFARADSLIPNTLGGGLKKIPIAAAAIFYAARDLYEKFEENESEPTAVHTYPAHWWHDYQQECDWAGVFQGGGAKACAYGGSLLAWAESGRWFNEVTGSSAGAITAALVAAGYHPKIIIPMSSDLLKTIEPLSRADRVFYEFRLTRVLTRYSTAKLCSLLELALQLMVEHHGETISGDFVTFADLKKATGIGLTVVVVDTSTGSPLPFCAQWSPDLSVAQAVVASCSIPVVFDPPFLEVAASLGHRWRRLADGGVFANYPSFVFDDSKFRSYYGLESLPLEMKTVGFMLSGDVLDAAPPSPRRFVTNPRNILKTKQIIRGNSRWLETEQKQSERRALLMALHTRGALSQDQYEKAYAQRAGLKQDVLASVGFSALVTLLQIGALIGIGYLIYKGGVEVARGNWTDALVHLVRGITSLAALVVTRRVLTLVYREGLQVLKTWSGTALRPSLWAGRVGHSVVIRTPTALLSTTSFAADRYHHDGAVWAAYVLAEQQIATMVAGGTDAVSTLQDSAGLGFAPLDSEEDSRNLPALPFRRPRMVRLLDFIRG